MVEVAKLETGETALVNYMENGNVSLRLPHDQATGGKVSYILSANNFKNKIIPTVPPTQFTIVDEDIDLSDY